VAEPPVRVLLDTHVIIWALTEPQRLSATAREIIESRENELLVSAASAWEIGTKYRLGKFPQLEATVLNFEAQLDTLGTSSLPVSTSHALLAGTMAWSHGDPFDRMLAAQAMLEAVPLVTSDSVFTRLEGVDVAW
jgi:PIN domain nuclease of toxin-antitoxin system